MKKYLILAVSLLPILAAPAPAEVAIHIGLGYRDSPDHHRDYRHRRHQRHHFAQPPVPVFYPYPVYVAPPPPPVALMPFTGNYGNDIVTITAKLSTLRELVNRQRQKEALSPQQYDHFMDALDGIEHDQHARAFDRGGDL